MKKLLCSIFTLGILLTSCQKEEFLIQTTDSETLEARGFGVQRKLTWKGNKQYKLSTSGLKKVKELEKKYAKGSNKVRYLMSNPDFEYLVYNSQIDNPGYCHRSIMNGDV